MCAKSAHRRDFSHSTLVCDFIYNSRDIIRLKSHLFFIFFLNCVCCIKSQNGKFASFSHYFYGRKDDIYKSDRARRKKLQADVEIINKIISTQCRRKDTIVGEFISAQKSLGALKV